MAATQITFPLRKCVQDINKNNCCYDAGLQCNQTTGKISRRLIIRNSHPACPSTLEDDCEPCNWETYRCERKKGFMSEWASNYERCHYGKDYIRFPNVKPCGRRACEGGILVKYDGSGYGVTEVGSNKQPKVCALQCKNSYEYISYKNNKDKDVLEKTVVKCTDGVV